MSPWAVRTYRALVRAYPRRYRSAYADGMVEVFAEQWREWGSRSMTARFSLALASLADLVQHVALAWIGALGERIGLGGPSHPDPLHPGRTPAPFVRVLQDLGQEVRVALRTFSKRPAFTALAVATVAMGVGGVTTIFGIVHAVLIEPLPWRDSDRLVEVWQDMNDPAAERVAAMGHIGVTPAEFHAWREEAHTVEDAVAYDVQNGSIGAGDDFPLPSPYGSVSWNFFDFLGVRPALGRVFTEGDEPKQRLASVAVLSHAYWTQAFGADPHAVGRTVVVNGNPYEIVGVLPRDFRWLEWPESNALVWIPRYIPRADAMSQVLSVLVRMRPGVAPADVQLELGGMVPRIGAEAGTPPPPPQWQEIFARKTDKDWVTVEPYRDALFGKARPGILLLMGAVGFLLVLACANLAALLLGRAVGREHEMAVRASLGAGRGRLLRQLLIEALVLAAFGCVVGLLLAVAGIRAIQTLGPTDVPRLDQAGVDRVVFAVCVASSLVSGLVFGLLPALKASRPDLLSRLGDGGRGHSASRGHGRIVSGLVVAELALSVVLAAGAAFMTHSLSNLLRDDVGFDPEGVWFAQLSIPNGPPYVQDLGIPYPPTNGTWVLRTDAWFDTPGRLLERLRADGRVAGAAVATGLPLSGAGTPRDRLRMPDAPEPALDEPAPYANLVEPGFLEMLRISTVAGRSFTAEDARRKDVRLAVVSRSVAERYWPDPARPEGLGQNAVGKRFLWHRQEVSAPGPQYLAYAPVEIVGVVENINEKEWGDPSLSVFLLRSQVEDTIPSSYRMPAFRVFLRPADPNADVRAVLVDALRATAPDLTLRELEPMTQVADQWIRTPRFYALLLALFGVTGALIVATGIAGVMATAVGQRTREIGVRIALGATPHTVLAEVMKGMLLRALGGLALGLAATLAASQFLELPLHNVPRSDPATIAAALAFMALVAVVASWLPARRATSIDPVGTLRNE